MPIFEVLANNLLTSAIFSLIWRIPPHPIASPSSSYAITNKEREPQKSFGLKELFPLSPVIDCKVAFQLVI